MARPRVVLNLAGIRELKRSPGVTAEIRRRGEMVLAEAIATAPVDTGAYIDDLILVVDEHSVSGAVAHIGSSDLKGHLVEASTGHLARALNAAGGA